MSIVRRAQQMQDQEQQRRMTAAFTQSIHNTLSQPLILDSDNTVVSGSQQPRTQACVDAHPSKQQE